jgi:hypothetical protein
MQFNYLICYGVSNASLGKFLCQESSRGQDLLPLKGTLSEFPSLPLITKTFSFILFD